MKQIMTKDCRPAFQMDDNNFLSGFYTIFKGTNKQTKNIHTKREIFFIGTLDQLLLEKYTYNTNTDTIVSIKTMKATFFTYIYI